MISGDKMKAIREELNMSQRDLAAESIYSKSHIRLMENGDHPVTKEMVNTLNNILKKKLKELNKKLADMAS